ncbi:MAG: platelet-activating factor acetylhydrolase IB subunit [Woeseiaceae bacterium]|nr:platelet-activating factor acetylhydrolase IB subunit [Woeseiaceae bacterium]
MFDFKVTILASIALFALDVMAQEPPHDLLPKFSVKPVEQNAPWAIEWWRDRHDEKIELAKGTEIDLVFVGDSITHGWEDEGVDVWQEYYQGRNALNLGFSGDRTEHVLWRLENGAVDGMSPSLVVLMIGTNNTGHRMDPAVYTAEGIERVVGELRERLPGTQVLVLGIFPRQYSPYNEMRKRTEEINQLISPLGDGQTVHFLDISQVFLREDATLREDLMPDLLHLNPAGYRVWAEAMEPTIKKLLQQ